MLPFFFATTVEPLPNTAPQALLIAQGTNTQTSDTQPSSYPYASIKLGAGFPWNYNGEFDLLGTNVDTSLKLNGGFTGELAVGYKFNQARAEVAVGYGNYSSSKQTFSSSRYGSFSSSSDGALNLTTVMVNGYYDIPITNSDGSRSRWSPYLGAGIGYANINAPGCSGNGCFSGGSTGGFAYQGNVGVSYRVGDRSQAFVETGYLGSTSGSIDRVNFDSFGSWRVFVGWRQGFGGASTTKTASAPQPSPTTEPVPAQEAQQPAVRGLW
jgi:hypothetical protein